MKEKRKISDDELSRILFDYMKQNRLESLSIMCEIDEYNYFDIHVLGGTN